MRKLMIALSCAAAASLGAATAAQADAPIWKHKHHNGGNWGGGPGHHPGGNWGGPGGWNHHHHNGGVNIGIGLGGFGPGWGGGWYGPGYGYYGGYGGGYYAADCGWRPVKRKVWNASHTRYRIVWKNKRVCW
ncbi:hypothetical protein [Aestuariivirga sp.]|uniref:hypothetical protein n=1 Tax=Aestuariivirga sp. TaxID=2650926 RepID=UPI0039E6B5E1